MINPSSTPEPEPDTNSAFESIISGYGETASDPPSYRLICVLNDKRWIRTYNFPFLLLTQDYELEVRYGFELDENEKLTANGRTLLTSLACAPTFCTTEADGPHSLLIEIGKAFSWDDVHGLIIAVLTTIMQVPQSCIMVEMIEGEDCAPDTTTSTDNELPDRDGTGDDSLPA